MRYKEMFAGIMTLGLMSAVIIIFIANDDTF